MPIAPGARRPISSSAAGLSNEDRSPAGVPQYTARSTRRMTLELRVLLYIEAERLIVKDCPSVFLMNTNSNSAVLSKVRGFEQTAYEGFGAQLAPMVVG